MLISAVDEFCVFDGAFPLRHQGSQHQRRTAPQVAGGNGHTAEAGYAGHYRHAAVHPDVRAHTAQVGHVAEAVFKHVFHDHAGALRHARGGQHLGLHVGGEAGVRVGPQLGESPQASRRGQHDGVSFFRDVAAHFPELIAHGNQIQGLRVGEPDFSSRHRRRTQQRACRDAIGDGGINCSAQRLHALDLDQLRARSAYLTAHGVDEVLQIGDFRFPGGVVDSGHAGQKRRGHHHVFRRADAGIIKVHVPGMHIPAVAVNHAAILHDAHAQRPQALQMQINGPDADFAPAGIGDRGAAQLA